MTCIPGSGSCMVYGLCIPLCLQAAHTCLLCLPYLPYTSCADILCRMSLTRPAIHACYTVCLHRPPAGSNIPALVAVNNLYAAACASAGASGSSASALCEWRVAMAAAY